MYRIHHPVKPTSNRFIQHKFDVLYDEQDKLKLRRVGPSVDSKAPVARPHIHLKLKKLLMEQEYISSIFKSNEILIKQIAEVARGRGTFDNHYDYERKSLNTKKRQKEAVCVTYENQGLLRKLMTIPPEYSHFQQRDDYLVIQKYRSNMIRYPPNWRELVEQDKKYRLHIREKLAKRAGLVLKKKPKDSDRKQDSDEKPSSVLSSDDTVIKMAKTGSEKSVPKKKTEKDRSTKESMEPDVDKSEEETPEEEKFPLKKKKWKFGKTKK